MPGAALPAEASSRDPLTAVDLFCGAGGISVGLERAGYRVLLATDWDAACTETFRYNFPDVKMLHGDIREISAEQTLSKAGLAPGELDLLIGGPPCQGFSIIGARVVHDPRNDLFREFLRVAAAVRPKCMVIENVPGMATLARGAPLREILDGYDELGYTAAFAEVLAAQYGVPQMRWRMLIVGFRRDLGVPPGSGFPAPTHGQLGIGDLIPNCTITPEEAAGFMTTREAIGDLPPVAAGQQVSAYDGAPACDYQAAMRDGLSNELHNHYAPRLSAQNLARIQALQPGQDWRDLPRELLPPGMQRAKRKDHTRRYSRMTWEGIPRSIITRFRDPKSGEYTHPEQDRTISIREAARIQSFPDGFVFLGTRSDQYELVGNAVPPRLGEAVAREVAACLRAQATHRLDTGNALRRRPTLSLTLAQPALPLDGV